MKIKKPCIKTGIFVLLIMLFSVYVSAFGVGSAYYEDSPLRISPGETKEIIFNLQNMPGPEDIIARPSIAQGSEIMKISSEDILVPVGGSVNVKAEVSIPSNAKIGKIYPVTISFTTVTKSESGTFGLGSSIGRNFNVIVGEATKISESKKTFLWAYFIVGIILILIIFSLILKKRKSKKSE